MKYIRLYILALATLLAVSAFAQNDSIGCSCENPIYVDSTYSNLQLMAGTHWYKAGTYSLPLKIFYVPDDYNAKAPIIRADLGCNGHYENEAVAALATAIKKAGIELPFYISLEDSVVNGKHCYYAEFPLAIRHLLFGVGLIEEVNAYVEVTCESNGSIDVTADDERRECKKSSIQVEKGKTYAVQAGDTVTSYLFPINEWIEKGFQITWTGTSDMTMHMVNNCDYYLTDEADPEHQLMHQKYAFTATKNTAQFIPEVLANFMKSYLCTDFYVRVDAKGAGSFVVDTIAAGEEDRCVLYTDTLAYDAKTQLLRLSKVTYKWNISNQLNHNVLFLWDKSSSNTMYLSTTCEPTEWSETDPSMVAVLPFTSRNDSNIIDLPADKMNELVMASNQGVLYVHFENAAKGNFTMSRYYLAETPCDMRDIPFVSFPDTITIEAYDMNKVYKVRPSDWEDHKVRITWKGTHDLKVFFATDCDPESSETDEVLTAAEPTMTFDVAKVNSLVEIAHSMDATFIYFHFQGADKAQLYFDTWKNPCADNTPTMTPSSPLNLLAEISPTYSLPVYQWKNDNMLFTWTGKKPISLYVSDTCSFSANPLDEKVLEVWTLQPGDTLFPVVRVGDIIENLADEDGYLYFQAYAQDVGTFSLTLTEPNCLDKGRLVSVPGTINIERNRSSLIYKISAEQLQNNDVKFTWKGETKLTMYVGYFCEFNLTANNKYVLKPSPYDMAPGYNAVTIEYETWQSWLSKADEGYVYLRFVSDSDGELQTEITATHEAKTCVEKSTLLPLPTTDFSITNDVIYRIDAATWAANNVRITWSGATASTMTLANNCDMATTIWSQAFVRSSASSGVHSVELTKETISKWTPGADGYLYAKFSNVSPGTITTETYTIEVPKTCLERSTLVPFGTKTTLKSGELYRIEPASWKFDQLRAVWTGSTALTLELKYDCDGTAKQSTHTIRDTLTGIESLSKATAPLYFVANANGDLTFESYTIVVEPTCEERAQEVKLGAFTRIAVGETYKISTQNWSDRNIRIIWTGSATTLTFSATCEGTAAQTLNVTDTLTQVESLASVAQLLYFTSSVAGTLMFEEWEPVVITPCEELATIMNLPDEVTVPVGGDFVWMFNAEAWKVNDIDFAWVCNSIMTAYINASCYDAADDATSLALLEFDANETITKTSAELGKIAEGVDTYAYVRFGDNKLPGKLRISIHEPAALDNVISELTADTMVEVYTVAGQQVYSGTYGNMSLTRGIYLIHTATQTLKVVR